MNGESFNWLYTDILETNIVVIDTTLTAKVLSLYIYIEKRLESGKYFAVIKVSLTAKFPFCGKSHTSMTTSVVLLCQVLAIS